MHRHNSKSQTMNSFIYVEGMCQRSHIKVTGINSEGKHFTLTLSRHQTWDLGKSKGINSSNEMKLYEIPEHDENKFTYPNRAQIYFPFFWPFLSKQKQKQKRKRREMGMKIFG